MGLRWWIAVLGLSALTMGGAAAGAMGGAQAAPTGDAPVKIGPLPGEVVRLVAVGEQVIAATQWEGVIAAYSLSGRSLWTEPVGSRVLELEMVPVFADAAGAGVLLLTADNADRVCSWRAQERGVEQLHCLEPGLPGEPLLGLRPVAAAPGRYLVIGAQSVRELEVAADGALHAGPRFTDNALRAAVAPSEPHRGLSLTWRVAGRTYVAWTRGAEAGWLPLPAAQTPVKDQARTNMDGACCQGLAEDRSKRAGGRYPLPENEDVLW